ncbi:MAG: aspartate kinase [Synergistaceae bacterium]|nr:aspartate kinase [Synergistaceae bacterium]
MSLIVSKFGGISLADVESVKKTADIILSDPSRRYVVVSAPGIRSGDEIRVTDMLYICHSRYANRENFTEVLTKIEERYNEIISGLGVSVDMHSAISDLKKNLFIGRSNEFIVSRGEYIMGQILADYLGWPFVDAVKLIVFNRDGTLNLEKSLAAVKEVLSGMDHAVVPGFYGAIAGSTTNIKTFERGGGDVTAAVIARAMEADLCEKWAEATEVFSADPAIVKNPEIIRNITYAELRELTYMGIDIVYEEMILILQDTGISLSIRNIHHAEDKGTLITATLPPEIGRNVAACIAGRRNFKIVHIHKFGLNKTVGIGRKVFGIFSDRSISCEHYLSGIYQFSIVVKSPLFDLKRAEIIKALNDAIEPESIGVETDLSLIAVIGEGMGTVKGIFAKIFNAIASANVKVRMIEQGADDLNILIGVYDEDFDVTVRALYEAMIQQ